MDRRIQLLELQMRATRLDCRLHQAAIEYRQLGYERAFLQRAIKQMRLHNKRLREEEEGIPPVPTSKSAAYDAFLEKARAEVLARKGKGVPKRMLTILESSSSSDEDSYDAKLEKAQATGACSMWHRRRTCA